MKIGHCDPGERVLVIAEIGNNHEGNYALAEEMVWRAAEAEVDAVKFQTFQTEEFVSRRDATRFQRLKSFELTRDQFTRLSEVAAQAGVLFISTPLDLGSAEFLAPLVAAFKIASGDNTFYPLLECVAGFGKPVLLSGGMLDTAGLTKAKDVVQSNWKRAGVFQELAVLHCVTSYPVEPTQANLRAITTLRREFHCPIGYSDHTLGIEACVLAVALGARIIEKHFTLDKNYSSFRDHQLSADTTEMRELVTRIRQAEILLGQGEKVAQPAEVTIEPLVRRSIVARRDLPAGTVVGWLDLSWLRPAGGLPPGEESRLLGKRLGRSVQAGEFLTMDALEQRRSA